MGLQDVRPAETCTSRAQTDRVGVWAGECVGDWPDEGAREWVGTRAGERTKPAEVWAGEPTERIGERANEWVGVHCVRTCVACVGAFFLMLVACVHVNQRAGDRANTSSVRTLRDGRADDLRTRGLAAVQYDSCLGQGRVGDEKRVTYIIVSPCLLTS